VNLAPLRDGLFLEPRIEQIKRIVVGKPTTKEREAKISHSCAFLCFLWPINHGEEENRLTKKDSHEEHKKKEQS